MVAMSVRQISELLRQLEAVRQVLGRHKIFCSFDTRVQVPNLHSNTVTIPSLANNSQQNPLFFTQNNFQVHSKVRVRL